MSGNNNACDVLPFMNTDISGIGVRISFYLQTIFLAALSARAESHNETTGALSTLIATSMAMALTALILGLKREPEMSFQDGLVVFYLLTMSWTTVLFSLPSFHRFPDGTKSLKLLSILQSYLIFAFVLVLLFNASTFGNSVKCNPSAVMVIFRPFSALKASRVVGVIVVLVAALYTSMTTIDYLPPRLKKFKQWFGRHRRFRRDDLEATRPVENDLSLISDATIREINFVSHHVSQPTPIYDLNISGELCMKLAVILILWAVTVMNTELLILWNHLKQDPSAQTPWQFGQVLPMFLLIQPFLNLVSTFTKYKLSPRQNPGYQI